MDTLQKDLSYFNLRLQELLYTSFPEKAWARCCCRRERRRSCTQIRNRIPRPGAARHHDAGHGRLRSSPAHQGHDARSMDTSHFPVRAESR